MSTPALTSAQASCADDYDPTSMPVAKARAFIHQFLAPVQGPLRVPVRTALGRVLAEDVRSPVDVPSHRKSAMDGWAMRGADLAGDGEATLAEIGVSFAGRPFAGKVGKGECVRIMTGGVVPQGADTVVMQERARAAGKSITFAAGGEAGPSGGEGGGAQEGGTGGSRDAGLRPPRAPGGGPRRC